MAAVGLLPMKLRRVLRAEVGREPEAAERPLHRSPTLRKIFKQGAALASDGGSLRPARIRRAEFFKRFGFCGFGENATSH